ncbi:MAG TPA: hypothetical protein VGP68_23355, partial [Gemmataceae bacterium]|nr:hypothetical protein [Gemmataceae bacterium]
MSYGQEGRIEATITRMLALARKQERLGELRTEVEAAVNKKPTWLGGKALLAVLDIQLGAKERGRQEWLEVFDNPKADPPPIPRFVFAQELEFYAGVEDLAIKSLEAGVDDMAKEQDYQFNNNPARRLIWWYKLQGRKADARKLLDRLANLDMVDPGYYAGNPGYWEYQVAQQKITIAQDMLRSGDPVGAIRIYNQLLAEKEKLEEAAQWGGGDFSQQAEMGMRAVLKGLKPELLPAVVEILLTPRAKPAPNQPMIDLVMIIEAQELKRASVTSLFASAIKATKQTPVVRKEAGAKLATLTTQYPTDISVQTASALMAFVEGRPEDIRRAVDRLINLVDSTSLEPLPANGKANARQRAEAALQIPLWLVARECLAKDQEMFWPQGEKLANRAAAAAKRQTNLLFATTIFGEWSRLDLERGDKAKAEADLNELLELAVPKPSGKPDPSAATSIPAPPLPVAPAKVPPSASIQAASALSLIAMQLQPPAVASPAMPVPNQRALGAGRGSVAPLTEEQFRQVYDVAMLAAELKLPQLSMRAVREACRGGPPIADGNRRRGGRYVNRIINGTNYLVNGGNANRISLDQAIIKLVPLWREEQVSPAQIYDVLAGVVMPAARPSEVFISSPALQFDQVYVQDAFGSWTPVSGIMDESVDDRGLSALLVDTAIEAKKIDDLRTKLESRAKLSLAELNAKIMLAILAMRTKDEAAAKKAIAVLAERIKKDSLLATNTAVGTLLAPLLTDQTYGAIVAPLLEKVAENYATAGNSQPAADTRFKLAASHLKRKDVEAARKQFKIVEGFGKRVGQGGYDPHLALAQEYLKARWVEDALRELAFHADELSSTNNPRLRRQGGTVEPSLQPAKFFALLVQELLELPAAKRYELLNTWTLPTEGRKNIRYYVDSLLKQAPPAVIEKRVPIPFGQVTSTMLLLAAAAKEAGKATELVGIAERMVAQKVENAELFQVLIYLELRTPKDAEPAVHAFADGVFARLTEKKEQPLRSRYYYGEQELPLQTRPSEYLFARLCSEQTALQKYAEMLWSPMQRAIGNMFNSDLPGQIQLARDRLEARNSGAPDATKDALPVHWRNGSARALWFAQDGYVTQAWSDQTSFLTFDMPLAGTFEFSADVYRGGLGDGLIGYGGVAFGGVGSMNQYNGGYGNQQPATVWAVGNSDGVFRNVEGVRTGEFNHFTVQVAPAKHRYLVNGQLLYEDTDPSPTSPWLMLVGQMR